MNATWTVRCYDHFTRERWVERFASEQDAKRYAADQKAVGVMFAKASRETNS